MKEIFRSIPVTNNENAKIALELKKGSHFLIKNGFISFEANNFLADSELKLTDKAIHFFLGKEAFMYICDVVGKNIIKCTGISKKNLYFTDSLQKEIDFVLQNLLQATYKTVTQRLKEKKMRTGIAALFYGDTGTGKTESVYQIARATGRDIFHVDVSETKSCWFGESEKGIKKIFDSYRAFCSQRKTKPILLFNEADAVFGKRNEFTSSNVAQTENAIQNIILEEMENLDGILIATTNFKNNFDSAFERRFLFKIRFEKPDASIMAKIWQNKLAYLNEADSHRLAEHFAFSGGEIENVVRKITMDEVLTGKKSDFVAIQNFCRSEKLYTQQVNIGFCG